MRYHFILCVALSSLNLLLVIGCNAEDSIGSQQAKPAAAVETPSTNAASSQSAPAASLDEPKKRSAPLGKPDEPKKPAYAALGGPDKQVAKPKFALKRMTPMGPGVGGNAPDRAAELKRLIDTYQGLAIRYSDGLVLATTPEEKEALASRAPSARALRPIAVLVVHLIATDPKDEPALEALGFLCKFIGTPEIDAVLAGDFSEGTSVDPYALLLEHHASNPKIISAIRRLPRGEETDAFLRTVFDKTFSPEVRWAAGAQLIASLRRNNRPEEELEEIVIEMSEDRYLEGVPVGGGSNARTWAANKLREIRTLGIGKELPEVLGIKLDGGTGNIADYRGKIVVLDVWTTWCGPCRTMIPHHTELTERLKDEPFAILSVSCDKDQETLTTFLEGTEMPWDHWWVAPDSEFKKTLNIASFPTIYVLDDKGIIRYKNIRDEQLDEAINTLLQEVDQPAAEPQS